MKYNRKRFQIVKDYKEDVKRFALFNAIAMIFTIVFNLILLDNPYNIKPLVFAAFAIFFLYSFFKICIVSDNRNLLLWLAELLILVAVVSTGESQVDLLWQAYFFVIVSFLYEIVLKFTMGVRLVIKPKEYSWCNGGMSK